MKTLAIETSTKHFSLATGNGDKILKSQRIVLKKVLSDSIIPAINKILKSSKLTLPKIDALVIGLGPGSFTSLRVGLSTVKALAFAADKPIIGIPSLDAVAMNVGETRKNICVLADARRNLVYGCVYERKKQTLKKKTDYLLVPLPELLGRIDTDTIFLGDAVEMYRPNIELFFSIKDKKFDIEFAPLSKAHPDAKSLIMLAQGQKFADLDQLVPLYLYPEDCQVTTSVKTA